MSSRTVNFEDFVTKHVAPPKESYTLTDLSVTYKDEPTAVMLVRETAEGKRSFFIKRTLEDRFHNPWDYQANSRSDIKFRTDSESPKWVRVNKLAYDKYMEFLGTGSRVALSKAEREYLDQ